VLIHVQEAPYGDFYFSISDKTMLHYLNLFTKKQNRNKLTIPEIGAKHGQFLRQFRKKRIKT